ncbi:MAG: hypothetical protein ACREOK_05875, partial [Gemmatimonadaceae bacterium]
MQRRLILVIVALATLGCDPPRSDRRPRRTKVEDLIDTSRRMDVRVPFRPPQSWEHVHLPEGLEFRQPPGFTIVKAPEIRCDSTTMADSIPVFRTALSDRWPLTLTMRRGDLARIARANGFTVDSADIAAHGQRAGDTALVRRGEGWLLLSGHSSGTPVLLASVRAPNGCHLLWAGRGVDINADTLGLVL